MAVSFVSHGAGPSPAWLVPGRLCFSSLSVVAALELLFVVVVFSTGQRLLRPVGEANASAGLATALLIASSLSLSISPRKPHSLCRAWFERLNVQSGDGQKASWMAR